ncbi:ATP-binding protein [Planococcus rifietoensis]|uniref:ATP-binding protein n=1 Tax=Planococcus rifietoensis TaxID=200991 RepID=UPI00384E870C
MPEINIGIPQEEFLNIIGNVVSPFVVISELIKNGVDANANSITVHINSIEKSIKIIDNGDGFYLEDIENIGMAAISRKKRKSHDRNNQGDMFLGSKGLALFSVFSLGENLEIKTKNKDNESYIIRWNKTSGIPEYELLNNEDILSYGTELTISDIEENNIFLLQSKRELNKFKHISISNYVDDIFIPKVVIIKDGEKIDIEVENIKTFESDFDTKVIFNYDEANNCLVFQYVTDDIRVNSKKITFNLNKSNDVKARIEKEYNFKPETLSFTEYLTGGIIERKDIKIPSFEGVWYVKSNRKNNKMKKFESGITIYVNNFALYNYLNRSNDWLQLTNINQVKKINNFRNHNVYGYINFINFNDLKEKLRISNERGGFIEDIYYHKFFDILYDCVLFTAINIDVAIKNNKFKSIESSGGTGGGTGTGTAGGGTGTGATGGGKGTGTTGGGKGAGTTGGGKGTGTTGGGKGTGTTGGGKGTGTTGEGKGTGTTGGRTGTGIGGRAEDDDESKEEKSILKILSIPIESGQNLYLKDPTIVNYSQLENLKIISQSEAMIEKDTFLSKNSPGKYNILYFKGNSKETLEISVLERKIIGKEINQADFFTTSNHFNGDIDLTDINDLVKQLIDLNYDQKYLLYIISFRAILEDMVKKYLSRRNIALTGNLKGNLVLMVSDIQTLMEAKKTDPLKQKKLEIMSKFKGRDAMNNFLVGISVKFQTESYDKFLHSLTHNPSKIQKDLALEIANDVILPLYKINKLLIDKNIIV